MDDEEMMEPQATKIEPERPIKKFFEDVLACLTEPRRFFTDRFPQYTLTQALFFAVIVNWIASFLEWMTRVVRHETLLDGFMKVREQLETLPMWKQITPHLFSESESLSLIPSWAMELASVAGNPFKTLFSLLISAVFIWFGALILIPKKEDQDPIDYVHFIKILALATSAPNLVAAILGFLPLNLGLLVGFIYITCLEVIALTARYKISGLRSLAIIFLPNFVLTALIACVGGLLVMVAFGFIGALFH